MVEEINSKDLQFINTSTITNTIPEPTGDSIVLSSFKCQDTSLAYMYQQIAKEIYFYFQNHTNNKQYVIYLFL